MEEILESGVARPAPWEEPAWRDAADDWIREALVRLNRPLTGPIEVVKQWCLSCVLHAPTDTGSTYFKAAVDLPLFVDEPAVLEGLSTLFPDNIPTVLAREPAQRWMLMEESGKTFRWEDPPGIEIRERTVATYARMHAYLAEWNGYESSERLLNAFAIAAPLSALHQTVSYQYIAAYGPPNTKTELGNAVENWLRRLVIRLNEI